MSVFAVCQGNPTLAGAYFCGLPGKPYPGYGLFLRFAREALPWLQPVFGTTQGAPTAANPISSQELFQAVDPAHHEGAFVEGG